MIKSNERQNHLTARGIREQTHKDNNYYGWSVSDLKYNLATCEKWLTEEYVGYHREAARREKAYLEKRDRRVEFRDGIKAELQRRKDLKNTKARCTRLAKKIGAEVEQENPDGPVWVYPPDDLYERDEDDPYFGSLYTEEIGLGAWLEAERRLKEYAKYKLPPTVTSRLLPEGGAS